MISSWKTRQFSLSVLVLFSIGVCGCGVEETPTAAAPDVANVSVITAEDSATSIGVPFSSPTVMVDSATLTLVVESGPTHGTTSVDTTSLAVLYTPAKDFNGVDSFTVRVCNENETPQCSWATVTVNVTPVNDAAVAVPSTSQISTKAIPNTVSGNVLSNDSDVDTGDVLTVAGVNSSSGKVGVPQLGTYGSITILVDGSYVYTLDNTNPTVDALAPGETLTDGFNYLLSDGTLTTNSTLTITILGANEPPVALADINSVTEDTPPNPISGNVLSNDSDSDGPAALTVSGLIGGTVGMTLLGAYGEVVVNTDGTYTYTLDNSLPSVHSIPAGQSVTDSFTYIISDGLATASATLTITMIGVDDASTAVPDTNIVTEDAPPNPATGNVLTNDFDFDLGAVLSVNQVNGSLNNVGIPVVGVYGSVTINADGTYSYLLDNMSLTVQALAGGQTETEVFTYQLSDFHGPDSISTLTITVHGANDTPVALPDAVTLIEDDVLSEAGNILTNDSDVDATDTLIVTALSIPGTPIPLGVFIPGDTAGGRVDADGTFSVTLFNTAAGVQSLGQGQFTLFQFTYTISDGTADAVSNVTFTILGANDAPIAADDGGIEVSNGTTINIDPTAGVLNNDTDVDALSTRTAVLLSGPAQAAAFVLNLDGSFTYTHDGIGIGTDSFTYQAQDEFGALSNAATVTITINVGPAANNDTYATLVDTALVVPTIDGVIVGTVLGAVADTGTPDPTVTSYGPVGGSLLTIPGSPYVLPSGSSVTFNMDGQGGFTYLPFTGFNGVDSFDYEISNSVGSDIATVMIVIQRPPTAIDDNPGAAFTVLLGGTSVFPPGTLFLNNGAGPDDLGVPTAQIVSWGPVTGNEVPAGVTVTPPDGSVVRIDADGGGIATPGTSGIQTFVYRLQNSVGFDTATVTATVNEGPTFTSATSTTFVIGTSGSFALSATGFPVAMTFTNTGAALPSGITLAANGTLSGTPAAGTGGAYTLQFTASNGVAPNAIQNFTLLVNQTSFAANDPNPALADTSSPGSSPYHIALNGSINGTINLLTNDNLGFPAATLISFGQNLSGVTAYPAGTSGLSANNGALTVFADGTFSYSPPSANFTGLDSFAYRLSSISGTADAVVTIAVGIRPSMVSDSRNVTGNIRIDTSTGTPFSVLTNDAGDQRVAFLVSSTNGNAIVNLDGTFSFNPGPGVTAGASFDYRTTNGFGSVQGTVTLNISNMVWFVDNSIGVNGDGRITAPFNIMSSAQAASTPGQVAFVYHNAGNYVGGYTLDSSERLIGQGVAFTSTNLGFTPAEHSVNLPIIGTNPTLTSTVNLSNNGLFRGINLSTNGTVGLAGTNAIAVTVDNASVAALNAPAITLSDSGGVITLTSVSSTGSASHGISLTNLSGSFTGNGGSIGTAAGTDFLLSGGSSNVSYAGTITNTVGRAVDINAHSGDVTLSGSLSDSGGTGIRVDSCSGGIVSFSGVSKALGTGANPAVTLSSNSGTLINFSNGGLVISTTTGTGFHALGGGTINVGGTGNTISSFSATALIVTDTTIQNGMTFQSISSGNNTTAADPVNGIVLTNTDALGRLSVLGDGNVSVGGNGSGGLIQNTSSHGIAMTNTFNPSFTNLNISGTGGSGVNGVAVTNFTYANGTITNAGNGNAESAIAFNGNPTGTVGTGSNISGLITMTGNSIVNPFYSGLDVQCNSGTLTNVTVMNNTISPSTGAGVNFVGTGSTSAVFSLNNATISGNTISQPTIGGIRISMGNASSGPGTTVGIPSDASNIISITGNFVTPKPLGTNALSMTVSGVNSALRSRSNFSISDNGTLSTPLGSSSQGTVLLVECNGYTTMTGTISNNVITATHTPNSGGGSGILASNNPAGAGNAWTPNMTLTVSGNRVSGTDSSGIRLYGIGTSGTAKLKVASNIVGASVNAFGAPTSGIRVDAGSVASADDAVFLNMISNTSAGRNGATGLGIFKFGSSSSINDFGIYDASGGPILATAPTSANVTTFINSLNPSGGSSTIIGGSNFLRDTTQAPP